MIRLALLLLALAIPGCRSPEPAPLDLRGRVTIEAEPRVWRFLHLAEGPRTTHSGNPPLWPCWCDEPESHERTER